MAILKRFIGITLNITDGAIYLKNPESDEAFKPASTMGAPTTAGCVQIISNIPVSQS